MSRIEALSRLAVGDWDGAHRLVQDDPSPEAAWIHAHLHRLEGDLANARYWYARAGRPESAASLDEEARRNRARVARRQRRILIELFWAKRLNFHAVGGGGGA